MVDSLEDLRGRAERLRVNAIRKQRRQAKLHHVNIESIQANSVTTVNNYHKLNRKQLISRIEKLEKFNSRSNQIYGDAFGRMVNSDLAKEYLKASKAAIKAIKAHGEEFADISTENGKPVDKDYLSVKDVHEQRTPKTGLSNTVMQDVFNPRVRPIRNFFSEKAMKDRLKRLKDVTSKDYWDREIKSRRDEVNGMLDHAGIEGQRLKAQLDAAKLNSKQFELLIRSREFLDELHNIYIHRKDYDPKNPKDWDIPDLSQHETRAGKEIAWAKSHFTPITKGPRKGQLHEW